MSELAWYLAGILVAGIIAGFIGLWIEGRWRP